MPGGGGDDQLLIWRNLEWPYGKRIQMYYAESVAIIPCDVIQ